MNARLKRFGIILLAMLLVLSMMPMSSLAAPKQKSILRERTNVTLDLAQTNKLQLGAKVLPAGASQRMVWASKHKSIATVNSKGVVTAKKVGTASIGVRASSLKKWYTIKVKVVDSLRPTSMSVPNSTVSLKIGGTYNIIPTLSPSNAVQTVGYTSTKSSVATVSSTGQITAKNAGTAYIYVRSKRNTGLYKKIKVVVAKPIIPSKIYITPATNTLNLGETLQLSSSVTPDTANAEVKWASSDTKIAKVSSTGLVTPIKEGTVKIKVYSKHKSSVYTIRTLKVVDPGKPSGIKFNATGPLYYGKGNKDKLGYTISPSTARQDVVYSSSQPTIVSVDADGNITCKKTGIATITVAAKGLSSVKSTIKVAVLNTTRTTTLPDRYSTSEGDIKENLAKIDAIRESAYNELYSLQASSTITSSDASNRKAAIANAFAGMSFAWTTPTKVNYWNSKLSENNFLTTRIYYGLPYIQCGANYNYSNRQYNLAKMVSGGYFKLKSGASRYYQMTSKRLNKFYVGSDCSSFVSMSIWGTSHSASMLNTTAMASSSYYKKVTGTTNLRPGDTLVKSGSHTVMFLYYLDASKTRMMIIENAGLTVSCKTANVATYMSNGYVNRRATKFK